MGCSARVKEFKDKERPQIERKQEIRNDDRIEEDDRLPKRSSILRFGMGSLTSSQTMQSLDSTTSSSSKRHSMSNGLVVELKNPGKDMIRRYMCKMVKCSPKNDDNWEILTQWFARLMAELCVCTRHSKRTISLSGSIQVNMDQFYEVNSELRVEVGFHPKIIFKCLQKMDIDKLTPKNMSETLFYELFLCICWRNSNLIGVNIHDIASTNSSICIKNEEEFSSLDIMSGDRRDVVDAACVYRIMELLDHYTKNNSENCQSGSFTSNGFLEVPKTNSIPFPLTVSRTHSITINNVNIPILTA